MKKINAIFPILFFLFHLSTVIHGQGVAINETNAAPDASAILDIASTTKGVLIPRMYYGHIENIQDPADGLIVFNTSDNQLYFFDAGVGFWRNLAFGNDTIDAFCGDSIVDSRDGKKYGTVRIGTQCWMSQNLDAGSFTTGPQNDNGLIDKWCYDHNPVNCDTNGALYTWWEVMQWVNVEGGQGVCPDGWHVPTDSEICTLEIFVDASIVCSDIGYRGINGGTLLKVNGGTGFDMPMCGNRLDNGTFAFMGSAGYFWASTFSYENHMWRRGLYSSSAQIERDVSNYPAALSVRCIKD